MSTKKATKNTFRKRNATKKRQRKPKYTKKRNQPRRRTLKKYGGADTQPISGETRASIYQQLLDPLTGYKAQDHIIRKQVSAQILEDQDDKRTLHMVISKEQQDNKPFVTTINDLYDHTLRLFGKKQLPLEIANSTVDVTQTVQ